jgi:galactosylceramidase
MAEAKRRNPHITLYGLSWGFPGWVSEGAKTSWTNSTVTYIVKWILGAKKYYNLDMDYIGIWSADVWDKGYTLSLKAAITAAGLKTKIVGHDSRWDVCNALSRDTEYHMHRFHQLLLFLEYYLLFQIELNFLLPYLPSENRENILILF